MTEGVHGLVNAMGRRYACVTELCENLRLRASAMWRMCDASLKRLRDRASATAKKKRQRLNVDSRAMRLAASTKSKSIK